MVQRTPMPSQSLLDVEGRALRAVGMQAGAGMALVAGHGGGAVVEHHDEARRLVVVRVDERRDAGVEEGGVADDGGRAPCARAPC